MSDNAATGRRGEDIAVEFLEGRGYRILERNYRFERSEVDIVCFEPTRSNGHGGEIVFVEVKTRRGTTFGMPEESVTREKQRHIIKASRAYLYEARLERSPCRFDVVSIVLDGESAPEVRHFKDAFWVS